MLKFERVPPLLFLLQLAVAGAGPCFANSASERVPETELKEGPAKEISVGAKQQQKGGSAGLSLEQGSHRPTIPPLVA